jgi:hypothetical protein
MAQREIRACVCVTFKFVLCVQDSDFSGVSVSGNRSAVIRLHGRNQCSGRRCAAPYTYGV